MGKRVTLPGVSVHGHGEDTVDKGEYRGHFVLVFFCNCLHKWMGFICLSDGQTRSRVYSTRRAALRYVEDKAHHWIYVHDARDHYVKFGIPDNACANIANLQWYGNRVSSLLKRYSAEAFMSKDEWLSKNILEEAGTTSGNPDAADPDGT